MALDRQQILDASFRIIRKSGVEKLSLRALAAELGIQAPSLYWHISNKTELMNLLALTFYAQAFERVPGDLDWREWLEYYGRTFHKLLLAQRDSALLCAAYSPAPAAAADGFATVSAPLVARGLSRRKALMYLGSVISLATGWALNQQQKGMRESLSGEISLDRSFRVGLHALVSGFED
jgi:TetR/AcrR family tetracycline transcriptional repressor